MSFVSSFLFAVTVAISSRTSGGNFAGISILLVSVPIRPRGKRLLTTLTPMPLDRALVLAKGLHRSPSRAVIARLTLKLLPASMTDKLDLHL